MDLTSIAVPCTLAHLKPLLQAPPARVLEVGCGRGALAAALAKLGYEVTGVDRDADMAAAAGERGVPVIQADVRDVSGEYDIVLFTRSLHHAESLYDVLAHAVTLLAPSGQLIIEEFAWEQVDAAAARFLSDNRASLVAAGLLDAELPGGDPLDAWVAGHAFLHQGAAMLAALRRIDPDLSIVETTMLWRLIDGHDGVWIESAVRVGYALNAIRQDEERRIAAGALPSVGLIASIRR